MPSVAVVIACHDPERSPLLEEAVRSAQSQRLAPVEVVVVVDHNPGYAAWLGPRLTGVTLLENDRARGAAGARNTGGFHVTADLIAFLDDDARAEPEWLADLLPAFDEPGVIGAGGQVVADWPAPPWWFPEEFGWVVGATHGRRQDSTVRVRNVWAENMIVPAPAFRAVGGFREGYGKVGDGAYLEDTELCIRMTAHLGGHWVQVPDAVVVHHVPPTRTGYVFFLRRCVGEGRAKAGLARIFPRSAALSAERAYVARALPRAFLAHLARAVGRGKPGELVRAGNLVVGLCATVYGYVVQRVGGRSLAGAEPLPLASRAGGGA